MKSSFIWLGLFVQFLALLVIFLPQILIKIKPSYSRFMSKGITKSVLKFRTWQSMLVVVVALLLSLLLLVFTGQTGLLIGNVNASYFNKNVTWKLESNILRLEEGASTQINIVSDGEGLIFKMPQITYKSLNPSLVWVSQTGLLYTARGSFLQGSDGKNQYGTAVVQVSANNVTQFLTVHILPRNYYYASKYNQMIEDYAVKPIILNKPEVCHRVYAFLDIPDDTIKAAGDGLLVSLYASDGTWDNWILLGTIKYSEFSRSADLYDNMPYGVFDVPIDFIIKKIALIPTGGENTISQWEASTEFIFDTNGGGEASVAE